MQAGAKGRDQCIVMSDLSWGSMSGIPLALPHACDGHQSLAKKFWPSALQRILLAKSPFRSLVVGVCLEEAMRTGRSTKGIRADYSASAVVGHRLVGRRLRGLHHASAPASYAWPRDAHHQLHVFTHG